MEMVRGGGRAVWKGISGRVWDEGIELRMEQH